MTNMNFRTIGSGNDSQWSDETSRYQWVETAKRTIVPSHLVTITAGQRGHESGEEEKAMMNVEEAENEEASVTKVTVDVRTTAILLALFKSAPRSSRYSTNYTGWYTA